MITGNKIREIVIQQSKRAHVGHIGSSLCIADILAALYGGFLNVSAENFASRDRFILSKGHAALALYATLQLKGILSAEDLNQFCGDGTLLGVHPEFQVNGVDFSTGSLGQGLSYGVGAALAARMQNSTRNVVVLMSDAECNEGAVWESIMLSAHHRLSNLIAIVDVNGQQALGYTKDVINLEPLAERWKSFAWHVHEIDGHDTKQIKETLLKIAAQNNGPHVLLARTVFGKGVSFMEGQIKWHYWPMSDSEYLDALEEIRS